MLTEYLYRFSCDDVAVVNHLTAVDDASAQAALEYKEMVHRRDHEHPELHQECKCIVVAKTQRAVLEDHVPTEGPAKDLGLMQSSSINHFGDAADEVRQAVRNQADPDMARDEGSPA